MGTEAHNYRVAARGLLEQVCRLYVRAAQLDPVKTRQRIEEAMRSLAQCIPDLKALLQRQNDQIDKLSSDVATANGKAADLQRQLDAANAQISAQVSDPALKSLNDILDANPTPAVSSSPEMTTFDQGK